MTIGQLAARFGLAASVLRHWDSVGVFTPSARISGRRHYSADDAYRVGVILIAREAGLSLEEIRQMLSTRRSRARHAMLRRKAEALDRQLEQVRAARRMVDEVMNCTAPDPVACPRFRAAIDRRLDAWTRARDRESGSA